MRLWPPQAVRSTQAGSDRTPDSDHGSGPQRRRYRSCGQAGHKSRDAVSDTDSGRQVQRYIRLKKLFQNQQLTSLDIQQILSEEKPNQQEVMKISAERAGTYFGAFFGKGLGNTRIVECF